MKRTPEMATTWVHKKKEVFFLLFKSLEKNNLSRTRNH